MTSATVRQMVWGLGLAIAVWAVAVPAEAGQRRRYRSHRPVVQGPWVAYPSLGYSYAQPIYGYGHRHYDYGYGHRTAGYPAYGYGNGYSSFGYGYDAPLAGHRGFHGTALYGDATGGAFGGSPNGGNYWYWLSQQAGNNRISRAQVNHLMYGQD